METDNRLVVDRDLRVGWCEISFRVMKMFWGEWEWRQNFVNNTEN